MSKVSHPSPTFRDVLSLRHLPANVKQLRSSQMLLTYNARASIYLACRVIARVGRRKILIPAFHCPSGVTPAIRASMMPVFYRVRRDLSIDEDDLLSKLSADVGAVLVIHFFGIPTDIGFLQDCRSRGVKIIEDWSHSFLRGESGELSGLESDFRVYSFWKLIPSDVGGGLWIKDADGFCNAPDFGCTNTTPWRERLPRAKRLFDACLAQSQLEGIQAAYARLEGLQRSLRRHGGLMPDMCDVKPDPRKGEDYYPVDDLLKDCRMPWLAFHIIAASDWTELARVRRGNYEMFCQALQQTARLKVLYPDLPIDCCPWVFPVLLRDRDRIDRSWAAAGVALHTFGIYLHSELFKSSDSKAIDDAVYLSENLLCLSIHQGIEMSHIRDAIGIINNFLKNIDMVTTCDQ